MDKPNSPKIAILIDADNAQASRIENILAEISGVGVALIKRIYGDWASSNLKSWRDVLLDHGLHPIQQCSYTKGKNASDIAMIIDAMDLLYSKRFDGFCLVTSDSDFTRLASRIREDGLFVYGFGEEKTPAAFVSACDKFIKTEILTKSDDSRSGNTSVKKVKSLQLRQDTKLLNLLRSAIEALIDEDGWAPLAVVGARISNQTSEFDTRNYGYVKLSDLVSAIGLFDVDKRPIRDGHPPSAFVRDSRNASKS